MTIDPPLIIGTLWGVFELGVTLKKRSRTGSISHDNRSLGRIWLVNLCSIALGIVAANWLAACQMPWPELVVICGSCLFVLGLIMRCYAMAQLGRFFTADVAIAEDHALVDFGLYRFVRHPSYAGILLIDFGFALSFTNWASLLIVFVPFLFVMLYRIHLEEAVLLEALGEQYRSYMRRTKRLLPRIY